MGGKKKGRRQSDPLREEAESTDEENIPEVNLVQWFTNVSTLITLEGLAGGEILPPPPVLIFYYLTYKE